MTALALTAVLTLPFQPHTTAELSDWYSDWLSTPAVSSVMLAELEDMKSRHPCFPEACLAATVETNPARANPTVAAPSGMGSDVEQWRGLVAAYTGWDVDRMLRIMRCESGGNPYAYNGRTGVAGLFQIHPLWQKAWPGDYYDPATNVAVAHSVWLEQGYGAWVCKG